MAKIEVRKKTTCRIKIPGIAQAAIPLNGQD